MVGEDPQYIAKRTIREVWAIHDFLARVGFDFGDIYVGRVIDRLGHDGIGVILKSQGKQAAFTAGLPGVDLEAWVQMWNEYLERHNRKEISDEEKQFAVENSHIGKNYVSAIMVLFEKGFELDIPESMKDALLKLSDISSP